MKRNFMLTLTLCCLLLAACRDASVGIIGGADGPTAIFVSESHETVKGTFGEQYEKKPIRMMKIDGDLYYDTGRISNMVPRCGTLDGNLKKTMELGQMPQNNGEANFEAEGYQRVTSITKEVPINGQWVIFKKFDGVLDSGIGAPLYGFYIKGHLNNAAIDSELVVLTDNTEITFSDVYAPLLSSQHDVGKESGFVVFDHIVSGDKWGLSLSAENVTKTGMTICFEQFGGATLGDLQTGAWYKIETLTDGTWQEVPTKMEEVVWHSIAYMIPKNDVTQMDVNWEFLYGALPSGEYRLTKEVMDFKETGNFEEKIYFAYFTIE